jgi:MFS family permease
VAKHFPESNRTLAMGIVTASGSFGFFISPMFTRYSLVEYGWESTLLFFAIFILIGLIMAFFLTTPKDVVGGKVDDNQTAIEALKEAFKNKSFIFLTLGFFVCGWHISLIATHIPVYINDRGLPEWCTVSILSMIGLFNIFGTLTSGYLAQKFSKKIILSTIYLTRGLVIAIFIFSPPSQIIAVLFGITFGFLWLSTVPPTMGLVGFIFGTKYIGLLYGIVFLSHQIGSFFGAYLGGLFHDLYGSYDYAWYISIGLSIFAALIHLPITEKQTTRLQTT